MDSCNALGENYTASSNLDQETIALRTPITASVLLGNTFKAMSNVFVSRRHRKFILNMTHAGLGG